MIQRVEIEQGVVLVTETSKDSAKRQAKSLSKHMKASVWLRNRCQYGVAPTGAALFALGWEAIQCAKAGGKMPKRKWKRPE